LFLIFSKSSFNFISYWIQFLCVFVSTL
jgi:hypothetical protein